MIMINKTAQLILSDPELVGAGLHKNMAAAERLNEMMHNELFLTLACLQ